MHDKKHKSMEKFNDICELKHQLLHYVMGEVGGGLEGARARFPSWGRTLT